jgi:hypothetical protein
MSRWRIYLFSEYIENEDFILYGDKIWLNHIESTNSLVLNKIESE